MAKQTVSRTALGAAMCRMIEQYEPERTRLFNDSVVQELVGVPLRVMMMFRSMRALTVRKTEEVGAGIYGVQVCRTRAIDDAVQAVLARGTGQLVILGAGLDTRPYRLPGIERVRVFEVDLPAVQENKKEKLRKFLGALPEHVAFVPIDFDVQTLEAVLADTRFDSTCPAVFIWEGVTQYLTEQGVRQTLSFLGKAAPGSVIVFTYVLKSLIERRSDIPGANHMMDVVAKQAPWIFGLETSDVSAFLEPYHLKLIVDLGSADFQAKYLQPLRRSMAVFAGERVVEAIVVA